MEKVLYLKAAAAVVQLKRIATGMYGQTRHTKYIESIEYLSKDELRHLQAVKLSMILKHTVENIPFYNQFKGKFKLIPNTVFTDIKSFPIVDKTMYRDNFEKFIDNNSPYVEKLCTGGTSSINVTLLRDRSAMVQRNNEFFGRMAGIYPGMSRINLSRHESSYHVDNKETIEIQKNKFMRSYFINSSYFGEEKLRYLYNLYRKLKPDIFKGNSAAIFDFANAIEKNGWEKFDVPIIYGGVSTMLPIYRETFERVFNSKVFNTYGTTELNLVSVQCIENSGMHYIPVTHYLEIFNENGEEAVEGEIGSLHATLLTNKVMPIIRYKIGDYATATNKNCGCGRTFPMILSIDGRLMESIMSPKGTFMSISGFKAILNKIEKIKDFQAMQTAAESLKLNLISKEKLSVDEIAFINKRMEEILSYKMKISIGYIDSVQKLPNGKILRVTALKEQ